jgi:hypothetical protein
MTLQEALAAMNNCGAFKDRASLEAFLNTIYVIGGGGAPVVVTPTDIASNPLATGNTSNLNSFVKVAGSGDVYFIDSTGRSILIKTAASSGDKHYKHDQPTAALSWTIAHNLGKIPTIELRTTTGDIIIGGTRVDDTALNTTTITFGIAIAGTAFCN